MALRDFSAPTLGWRPAGDARPAPASGQSFLAAHEWAVSVVPRLRDRVVDDPFLVATPEWVPDDGFDLAYHVRRMRLPDGGGVDDLIAIAQVMAMSPFDRARPLWEAVLDRRAAGRARGLSAEAPPQPAGRRRTDPAVRHPAPRSSEPAPDPPPAADEPERRHEPPSLLEKRLPCLLERPGTGTKAVLGLSSELIRRPEPTIDGGLRFVHSLARLAGPPPASPSPLMTERGISRRLQMLDVPLAWMRAAGKAADGSVNDVFLAALTGALRRYHEPAGVVPDELPIGFPVSLRRDDDPLGGNRFSGARIAAPVGIADPAERIRLIRELRCSRLVMSRRSTSWRGSRRFSARIPPAIVTRMTERVTRSIDLQASNFPGLTRPAYLAGAQVTRMYPFGPAPGSAAMVTMLSHNGMCCIGITADAAAIPDVGRFAECVRAGFDEVLALAGHSLEEVTEDPSELVGAPES